MKKMINFRNFIIAILCVTIICLSVGFIVLSVKLKDKIDDVDSYDVSIINVEKKSSVKGSSIEPIGEANITANKKEIEFNYAMNANNDEIVYVATIRNNGTMKAKIVDIIGSPDYTIEPYKSTISPVTIDISDIKDKVLEPGREIELRVSALYNSKTITNVSKKFSYKIGLITQYVE